MSKRVAIDALTHELRTINEEVQGLQQEAAQIARVISMLTGKDAGEGRVSIKGTDTSHKKRPRPDSQGGKVLEFIEAKGPVTMQEIIDNFYGKYVPRGSAEYNRIGIYPGTLVSRGHAVKTGDGRYKGVGTSTNGSAPAPVEGQEEVKVPF